MKNKLRRKSPAPIGRGLRRIICCRSSAKVIRLVTSFKVVCPWPGKRVAVMSAAEREIVRVQVKEENEG